MTVSPRASVPAAAAASSALAVGCGEVGSGEEEGRRGLARRSRVTEDRLMCDGIENVRRLRDVFQVVTDPVPSILICSIVNVSVSTYPGGSQCLMTSEGMMDTDVNANNTRFESFAAKWVYVEVGTVYYDPL